MKTIDRLLESQHHRQAAIDYLIEHPGTIAPDICAHLGWEPAPGASRLSAMANDGELRREAAVYIQNAANGKRRQATYRYFALVTKTKQAIDVLNKMGANLASERKASEEAERKKNRKPWLTVNDPSDHPPIQRQGGQGSVNTKLTATYLELNA